MTDAVPTTRALSNAGMDAFTSQTAPAAVPRATVALGAAPTGKGMYVTAGTLKAVAKLSKPARQPFSPVAPPVAAAPEPEPLPEPEPEPEPLPAPVVPPIAKKAAVPTQARRAEPRAAPLPSWKRPYKPIELPSDSAPPKPSFSEMLAKATGGAEEVLAAFGDEAPGLLLSISAKRFSVAKVDSKLPGMVRFFSDRCEYSFQHFLHGGLDMVMFYSDMAEPRMQPSRKMLSFRIARKSLRWFADDYDSNNPSHRLQLEFNSDGDLAKFKTICWRLINRR